MLSRSCRPSGHAVSRKRSAWSFPPSSNPRCDDGSTHDRSRLAPARIAIPSRRNFGRCHCRRVMAPVWRGTSRRCGSMLSRRWRPSEHRRFLALIPRGDRHVPSDWRRDDAVTGGPRATDRDAIPGEVSSGSGMMTAVARHRSEAPIYS